MASLQQKQVEACLEPIHAGFPSRPCHLLKGERQVCGRRRKREAAATLLIPPTHSGSASGHDGTWALQGLKILAGYQPRHGCLVIGQGYPGPPTSSVNPHGAALEAPSQLTTSMSACQNAWKLGEQLSSGSMCLPMVVGFTLFRARKGNFSRFPYHLLPNR